MNRTNRNKRISYQCQDDEKYCSRYDTERFRDGLSVTGSTQTALPNVNAGEARNMLEETSSNFRDDGRREEVADSRESDGEENETIQLANGVGVGGCGVVVGFRLMLVENVEYSKEETYDRDTSERGDRPEGTWESSTKSGVVQGRLGHDERERRGEERRGRL
jgi:hypothetical protein